MTQLNYERCGSGDALLLIHGTGGHWQLWLPVLDRLAQERDVIAVDLPGHGRSAPTGPDVLPDPPGFARILGTFLDDLGLDRVHVAGNSAGGWTALEMAKLGRARSVTALSPGGLWRKHAPLYDKALLCMARAIARAVSPVADPVLHSRVARTIILGNMFGKPWQVPSAEAIAFIRNYGQVAEYWRHLHTSECERFAGGTMIEVPVTVAWGQFDFVMLPHQARYRDELPAHTCWLDLPGCGHIPTYDNPSLVAELLLSGSGSSSPR
jgi:pimeloyl-ACP methyl ester carboxylesterase